MAYAGHASVRDRQGVWILLSVFGVRMASVWNQQLWESAAGVCVSAEYVCHAAVSG